jgi:hypothetical protein
MNKTAAAGMVILWGLAGAFLFTSMYIIMDQGINKVSDYFYPTLTGDAKNAADFINEVWDNAPIFFIIGLTVGMVLGAIYNKPDIGY